MTLKHAGTKTRKKTVESPETKAPDHLPVIPRLNRIRGQIDGIEKMIQDGRYCVEILQQIKAARSAMLALESTILRRHLEHCVQKAFLSKNAFESTKKIDEIVDLICR